MELSATKAVQKKREREDRHLRFFGAKKNVSFMLWLLAAYAVGMVTGLFLSPIVVCDSKGGGGGEEESTVFWRSSSNKDSMRGVDALRTEIDAIRKAVESQHEVEQDIRDAQDQQFQFDREAQRKILENQIKVLRSQLMWQKQWQDEQNDIHRRWQLEEEENAAVEEKRMSQDIERHIDREIEAEFRNGGAGTVVSPMYYSQGGAFLRRPPAAVMMDYPPEFQREQQMQQQMMRTMRMTPPPPPPPPSSYGRGTAESYPTFDIEDEGVVAAMESANDADEGEILPSLELTPSADLGGAGSGNVVSRPGASSSSSAAAAASPATVTFEDLFAKKVSEIKHPNSPKKAPSNHAKLRTKRHEKPGLKK